MKPVIGIIPLFDTEKDSIWMIPGYQAAVEAAGGMPIILPYTVDKEEIRQAADMCGGFLFTGGQDVDPAVYNEEKKDTCGENCHIRDVMEREIFDIALAEDKPVFGICRGIQLINAFCGGTLYQDLPTEFESSVDHHMTPPYDKAQHSVDICAGTPLHDWLGVDTLKVNSYHHQAVKKTADSLVPMAYSEDGLVEAVYMPGKKFIAAVQWHPELNFRTEPTSVTIMKEFVRCAGE